MLFFIERLFFYFFKIKLKVLRLLLFLNKVNILLRYDIWRIYFNN